MIRLIQSNWMVVLIGTILYLATTVFIWRPPHVPASKWTTAPDKLGSSLAAWNFKNPEVDLLIADLRQQREVLSYRESELNEFDARLRAEWQEIGQATQTVSRLQREFERTVVRVREEEAVNLKKLAKMYAVMTPEGAASIFREMEDEQIVRIMAFMKDSETAPILETFALKGQTDAKRAAAISDRLRLTIARPQSDKGKNS